jgi:hypothetical protein
MPQFPRFTSGSVGRLTFDVVNDLFARVESLEASMRETRTGVSQIGSRILMLKVGQTRQNQSDPACTEAAWEEVSSKPCGGIALPNARTSTKDNDPFFYPLYGRSIVANMVVPAFAHYDGDGKLVYRAIEASASAERGISFAKVISSNSIGPGRWKYSVQPQTWTGTSFIDEIGGQPFDAWNSVESMPDPVGFSTGQWGVGFIPPQGLQQLERLPIRAGIIVMISETVFCVPNGYLVTCG